MLIRAATPQEFRFDQQRQRYVVTSGAGKGQFLSQEAVENLTRKAIAQHQQYAERLTQRLFRNEINVDEWESEVAALIQQNSIWQYSIGVGGIGKLESRDYGVIGSVLRTEYAYLRGFSEEVLTGNLSEAQIKARLNLYFNKTRSLYERGRRESHRKSGYIWERRQLNSGGNECADCFVYNAMAWQILGTLPSIGDRCSCKANCACSFSYSKSISRPN